MEPIRSIIEAEIRHIGFDYSGDLLQCPIYSFYDQANYQTIRDLPKRMYEDLMLYPLYWDKALIHIAKGKTVTHVLDFGPGKTTQRLSTDTLADLQVPLPVLALALPKELAKFL